MFQLFSAENKFIIINSKESQTKFTGTWEERTDKAGTNTDTQHSDGER